MMPWYRFLTDLGDRGRETEIRSIRTGCSGYKGGNILIARAEMD